MALEVEDGTGKADADAFVSLDDCDAYCVARGLTDWTGSPDSPSDIREAAIRRATQFLSTAFTWKGYRLRGRTQALAWPRTGVEDEEDEEVASDEVPVEIVQATCEAAAYEVANPGALTPAVDLTQRVKRKKIGPMEKEYFTSPTAADAARPMLFRINDLISGLLAGSSNGLAGSAVRW